MAPLLPKRLEVPIEDELVAAGLTPEQINEKALKMLKERGVTACRVIRVNDFSILYLRAEYDHKPMTAWLWEVNGGRQVTYEPGFPAFPSEEMVPRDLR